METVTNLKIGEFTQPDFTPETPSWRRIFINFSAFSVSLR
jgi:hypothetical protein